jgi:hypothetical protein
MRKLPQTHSEVSPPQTEANFEWRVRVVLRAGLEHKMAFPGTLKPTEVWRRARAAFPRAAIYMHTAALEQRAKP